MTTTEPRADTRAITVGQLALTAGITATLCALWNPLGPSALLFGAAGVVLAAVALKLGKTRGGQAHGRSSAALALAIVPFAQLVLGLLGVLS